MCIRNNRVALIAFVVVSFLGCGKANTDATLATTAAPPVVEIDESGQFEDILKAVDDVIGKRIQQMEIGGMIMANYHFDGSIDKVIEIIEPLAKQMGYSSVTQDKTSQASQEEQGHMQAMPDVKLDLIGSKVYQHENGNIINILRMDTSTDTPQMKTNMKMLSVQMVNIQQMMESSETKHGAIESKTPAQVRP